MKFIPLMIVLLLGVPLGACIDLDDDGEDDITENDITEDNVTEFRDLVIGTWVTGCRDETEEDFPFNGSISTWEITEDAIINTGVEYNETTCDTEYGDWGPDESDYEIGAKVVAADGLDAWELDVIETDKTMYVLARIVNGDEFHVSDTGGTAESEDERPDQFTGESIWYKQE